MCGSSPVPNSLFKQVIIGKGHSFSLKLAYSGCITKSLPYISAFCAQKHPLLILSMLRETHPPRIPLKKEQSHRLSEHGLTESSSDAEWCPKYEFIDVPSMAEGKVVPEDMIHSNAHRAAGLGHLFGTVIMTGLLHSGFHDLIVEGK